jgi:hypothetical protein
MAGHLPDGECVVVIRTDPTKLEFRDSRLSVLWPGFAAVAGGMHYAYVVPYPYHGCPAAPIPSRNSFARS